MKQGVSLSFNTIIVAIIALLVLGIIIFLLTGGLGNFREGTACVSKGGKCVNTGADSCASGDVINDPEKPGNLCGQTGKICCPFVS